MRSSISSVDIYRNVSRCVKSYFRFCQVRNKEGLIFRFREAVKTLKMDIQIYDID